MLALAALLPLQAQTIVHRQQSSFENIIVYEADGERCMKFGSLQAIGKQTCQSVQQPQTLLFDYTRMMMASLYLKPDPRNILIIGLGGGSLPTALASVLPRTHIDTVEIDPAVLEVAQRFFGFAPGPLLKAHVAEGRAYVQQAAQRGQKYDIVMLDAFDENYIPKHLLTVEFLREVRSILRPGGVVAANTFSASKVYADESATYAAVFGQFYNLRRANRVILAQVPTLADMASLEANAKALDGKFAPLGVQRDRLLPMFNTRQDWPATARVLRD